jgi:hypothetical protein
MDIYGYGEDALTLWAIQNKLEMILRGLGDPCELSSCQAFFRPSFGRRGGEASAQFGEFDFILLTASAIYLGESKWDRSSEQIRDGTLQLRPEQLVRHELFKFYVEEWAFGPHASWQAFETAAKVKLAERGMLKPVAPEVSLLATNLQAVLALIKKRYTTAPSVRNVLLYLHGGAHEGTLPRLAGDDFTVVAVNYSEGIVDGFVKLA